MTGFAALALMLGVAACGGGGGDDATAPLRVYVSVPLHGERAAEGRAIVKGVKSALADAGGRAGDHEVDAIFLDDTGGGPKWDLAATAANARSAAQDTGAIGYIGDLDSGATRVSLPITNQAEMVQISPGATAVDLTRRIDSELEPSRYRPSGEQTFARIVPDDQVQARAAAVLSKELGADAVALDSGTSQSPEELLRRTFEEEARRIGIRTSGPGGIPYDVVYFTGTGASPNGALAGSTLMRPARPIIALERARAGALRLCARFPSSLFLATSLAGAPTAYGYEAMSLLLDAIAEAGADRREVTDEVLATKNRRSAIGTYSITEDGDTTLGRIGVQRLDGCSFTFDRVITAGAASVPTP